MTPDVAAASMGAVLFYGFWHWLKRPRFRIAILTGIALGLAELTKGTWVVLFVLLPLLWLLWMLSQRDPFNDGRSWRRTSSHLLIIVCVGLYTLHAGFLFEGSCRNLGDFHFVSYVLSGQLDEQGSHEVGNRFRETPLAQVPVPFPANFVRGLDLQRYDFERPRWSYLAGVWRREGWWYYYFYALGAKLPLGTLLLIGVTCVAFIIGAVGQRSYRDLLPLFFPPAILLLLLSTQTGLSRHHRYALIVLPYLFIGASGLLCATGPFSTRLRKLACILLAASIGSSLWCYPHSLSYFNEGIGGPTNGPKHLLDSNIDWGQDMFLLKRWYDAHPEARPLGIAPKLPESLLSLEHLGFGCRTQVPSGELPRDWEGTSLDDIGPQPGWYAVSVCGLYSGRKEHHYLRDFATPVDRIGYSMYIYHLDRKTTNRIRRELGFPSLPEEAEAMALR